MAIFLRHLAKRLDVFRRALPDHPYSGRGEPTSQSKGWPGSTRRLQPLRLAVLSGFTAQAVGQWAGTAVQPGTLVLSDGLSCFPAVELAGCVQLPNVVGKLKPRDMPEFKWINTAPSNLKTMLAGTFHCMNFRKYAQNFLSAFAYRFNRRFDLKGLVARLIVDVTRSKPCQESLVSTKAETDCQSGPALVPMTIPMHPGAKT